MTRRPTPTQIDTAIQHEYPRTEPPTENMRYWVPDASLQFTISGPVAVHVTTELNDSEPLDDLYFKAVIGNLALHLDIDGAEALAFGLIEQLYGDGWARVLMALCSRCPVDFEAGCEPELLDEDVQALWKAAYSFKDRWPDRTAGFDDRIWGVPAPEGVTPIYPEKEKHDGEVNF